MDKTFPLKYMPDYYGGVYEMEELLKSQGTALTEINDKIVRTLLNQFIITSDEKGIAIFENEAGIKPDPNDTLETRRNNVLLRLLPPKPLTIRYLNYLLRLMNLEANVTVDYGKRLAIVEAESVDISAEKLKSIRYMLNVTLPANMIYSIRVSLSRVDITNQIFFGIATTAETIACAKANLDQLNFRNDLISEIYIGAGVNVISEASTERSD